MQQTTIKHSISCTGYGLHSNAPVRLTLKPAPIDFGIKFKRIDLSENNIIDAKYNNVKQSPLNTTLINKYEVQVATVEHLMAALWGCGVDNCLIEINNIEMPIMDGSSEHFVFMIESAGIKFLEHRRKYIKINQPVTYTKDNSYITVEPYDGLSMELEIKYDNKIIGNQKYAFDKNISFKHDLSRARTYCLEQEVEYMWSKGLAKGGSLNNAVVVGNESVINQKGLRYKDEFIRHKTLDCLGDMYLAGNHILGKIKGSCIGHAMNNNLLQQLFNNQDNWQLV